MPDQLEGIGRYEHQLLRRLVRLRPKDQFLFCFDRPFDQRYIYDKNVEGCVVHPPARHPFLWYLWYEWSLPRRLRRWRADLLISMDGYTSLSSKVPDLLVIHDLANFHAPDQVPWLVRRYLQYYVPRYAHKASRLATVSEYSKRDMQEQLQLADKKISLIPNGVPANWQALDPDEKIQARKQWADGHFYFCALGAIHPRKNVDGIIRGFDAFKKNTGLPHLLLIIGRQAWQLDAVQKALSDSPFRDSIRLVGYQPDEAVHQILGAADALLFLSLFEGFGVPMIEAMQLGIPIVYSDRSVIPEVAGGAGEM